MARPRKIHFPTIDLPEQLIFTDCDGDKITVDSDDFCTEVLTDDYQNAIGYRLEGDVSGNGTVAFNVYSDHVETVSDDSIDTSSLDMTDETFCKIEIKLPEAK